MTLLEEAEAIRDALSTPLYKAIIRTAAQRAHEGDVAGLEEAVEVARRDLAKQRSRDAVANEAEERRLAEVRRDAAGQDPDAVARTWRKLRTEQDAAYRRRATLRPDDRSARKGHMENDLDGRARGMAALAETYEALTGQRLA